MVSTAATSLSLPDAPPHLLEKITAGKAVAWAESIQIDTYSPQAPSVYPMYLDHRVYQGSSGKVYPLPFYERINSTSIRREWQAIHLENKYVRLVVLPELGGRIHIGYDKTTGYDFFYRNNVIKPALVGLAGPWISGGVEFNWPQHHRPATFLSVSTCIEEDDDGSVVVWCSDYDPFARMQGTHGVRLHPDRSIVQLDVRLHNRTSDRQTFLWWANVAVRVHDQYQSFFPEDVSYVADHARRAITTFPAADRPYYGVDYPARADACPGADRIDFYRNIPVPTSYMVVDTEDDFFGGYDHAAGAGFVHWADRRIAPGKKQWTWGDAPFGHAWDSLLTDADGPYVELMAGAFTDNQPDFAWLRPGESKLFSQYWFPIPAIGVAHQATPYAAVHVERGQRFAASFAVTSARIGARAVFRDGDGAVCFDEVADLVPGVPWAVEGPAAESVELWSGDGTLLVAWRRKAPINREPWVASEPPVPADIGNNDELYLTGVHLLQYRHPTRSPLPYWNEALARDPGDVRVRLALAELDLRSGAYESAHRHLREALARTTKRNANPRDAEVFYLLGLVEARRGRLTESAAALSKAMWDGAFFAPAGLELARLAAQLGDDEAALRQLDELDSVAHSDRRRAALRVLLLRRTGRASQAAEALCAGLADDPLNPVLRYLHDGSLPDDGRTAKDVAGELVSAGETAAALEVLAKAALAPPSGGGNAAPLARYQRAMLLDRAGYADEAALERAAARASDLRWAFPAGLDDHDALSAAIAAEDDHVAQSLMGMLLYGVGRRREALKLWERAIDGGSADPIVHRNAGLASYNVAHDDDTAVRHYDRAGELDPSSARLLFERDQLAQRLGESTHERLARLEPRLDLVLQRDDLVVEYADLLVAVDRAEEALDLIGGREFQPWEGGEGRALRAWDEARAALGLPLADPPRSLGEARTEFVAPVARHSSGETDYFATSLPDLLLFARE